MVLAVEHLERVPSPLTKVALHKIFTSDTFLVIIQRLSRCEEHPQFARTLKTITPLRILRPLVVVVSVRLQLDADNQSQKS